MDIFRSNKEKCVLCNLKVAYHYYQWWNEMDLLSIAQPDIHFWFFSSSLVDDPLYLQSINDFSISEVYLINAKSVI